MLREHNHYLASSVNFIRRASVLNELSSFSRQPGSIMSADRNRTDICLHFNLSLPDCRPAVADTVAADCADSQDSTLTAVHIANFMNGDTNLCLVEVNSRHN
jgi:hypothetical protein